MWNHRSLAPPGPLPHYLNITIMNIINGATGTADHMTLERPVLSMGFTTMGFITSITSKRIELQMPDTTQMEDILKGFPNVMDFH